MKGCVRVRSAVLNDPPLLRGLGDLLQPATGLLQLCQGVGRGQRGHGWVLDEGVAGVVAAQVSPAPHAVPAPRVVTLAGQDLGVERVGLLQALSAVGKAFKKRGQYKTRRCNFGVNDAVILSRRSPVWLVLALPLALQDPLPNILRAIGGVEGKARRRHALVCGLDRPSGQSAAATESRGREGRLELENRPASKQKKESSSSCAG